MYLGMFAVDAAVGLAERLLRVSTRAGGTIRLWQIQKHEVSELACLPSIQPLPTRACRALPPERSMTSGSAPASRGWTASCRHAASHRLPLPRTHTLPRPAACHGMTPVCPALPRLGSRCSVPTPPPLRPPLDTPLLPSAERALPAPDGAVAAARIRGGPAGDAAGGCGRYGQVGGWGCIKWGTVFSHQVR